MPQTSTAMAIAAALIGVTLLLAPGWGALRLLRIRGLLAFSLAPAGTTAMLALGAILAEVVGIGWGWGAALGAVALGLGTAALIRWILARVGPARASHPAPQSASAAAAAKIPTSAATPTLAKIPTSAATPTATKTSTTPTTPATPRADLLFPNLRLPRGDRIAIGVGLAVVLYSTMRSIGDVDAYLQRWDAVFHLSALRRIAETGAASSLTLGSLAYGDGHGAPYPAGWHAFASLLPASPTAQLTIAALLASGVAWVLGCAALGRALFPNQPRVLGVGVAGVAALLASVATISPISLWIGWGHVPNAAGFAMVGSAVALGIAVFARGTTDRIAAAIALAVVLLGVGLTHPNAGLAVGVLLIQAAVAAAWRITRHQLALGYRARAAIPAVAVLGIAALALAMLVTSPLTATVVAYTEGEPLTLVEATGDVVFGRYRLWTPHESAAALAAMAIVGAIWAATRRSLLPAGMLAVAWLLYIDAATGGHLIISRLWYTSPARISVIVGVVAIPLAASGLVRLVAWARDRLDLAGPILAPAIAATLLLAVAVPGLQVRGDTVPRRFEAEPGHPPQFVTTGEIAMIENLELTPGETVLGNPFSGVASAYGLAGVPAVFPVANQVWSEDQRIVMENLDAIAGGDAEVCSALDRLGVGYLYQDTKPYQGSARYRALDELEVPGAVVIATGDTARVLELPACVP